MQYIRVTKTEIEFPFDMQKYRQGFDPNIMITEEDLVKDGIFEVERTAQPSFNYPYEMLVQGEPVLKDEVLYETWKVVPRPDEELNKLAEVKSTELRSKRNQLLAETDYIVTMSTELGQAVPLLWRQYRQALRNVPEQPGFPFEVVWPDKPTL